MAYDLEEQESIDQMKAWWEKWGTPITAAVCICCLGFAGWNGWRWYQQNQVNKASAVYVALQTAVINRDQKNIQSTSEGLINEYGSTVYAPLGAMTAAAAKSGASDFEGAIKLLNWVINDSGYSEYADVARVRLAAVQLSAGQPDAALATLSHIKTSQALEAEVNDRCGDAYFAKKDYDKARESWQKVLTQVDMVDDNLKTIVGFKLGAIPAKE